MDREKTVKRTLIDEWTSWSVKTTYVGVAYSWQRTNLTTLQASAVWKISKYVETTSWSDKDIVNYITLDSKWELSEDYNFIWDNRLTYNYG